MYLQKYHKKIKYTFLGFFLLTFLFASGPVLVFAQNSDQSNTSSNALNCTSLLSGDINNLKDIIDLATCLLTRSVFPLLIVLAIAFFLYGVIQYYINPNNIAERDKAKDYILWALIGLFVIVSFWGLIEILRGTFGITGNALPILPETQ